MGSPLVLSATVVALLVASGCGSTQDDEVAATAAAFYAAVEAGDGAAACALLSPRVRSELEQSAGAPCRSAVLEEGVPAGRGRTEIAAYGSMAQVRGAADTAFLSRFADGWRVVAAGCTPTASGVYDCRVAGG